MVDRTARMYQRIFGVIQEEMQGYLSDQIVALMKSLGLDAIQLQGMMGKQATFDSYRILGLDKAASDEEIKKRYHQLLRKLHPDTAGVEGTAFLLQMILAAYEIIRRERNWQ
jgi:DnaJ-domain-containing protein 1